MSHTVKDAKNNLSTLIRLAERGAPQVIRRNGTEVAVVVSITEWRRIKGDGESLVEFLRNSPLDEIMKDLDRSDELPREVDLG
ncbi:MAG: type II toxin-antitoxin system Phd/YefM family antitoxin [Acidobacteria bacterium]|nr:type II toxin-antitoxin system Phd/YefM family antitoxin [Acidobacteriota bacterium]MBK8150984.1 type II toxin-antitoxin system Phd/YefM family antitoxin [Acidobacteriota bacterium]MBK8812805.1 type II toxin-antitoxin system Phd/YefM family antitoxin [Acidobacteriota bacterium]